MVDARILGFAIEGAALRTPRGIYSLEARSGVDVRRDAGNLIVKFLVTTAILVVASGLFLSVIAMIVGAFVAYVGLCYFVHKTHDVYLIGGGEEVRVASFDDCSPLCYRKGGEKAQAVMKLIEAALMERGSESAVERGPVAASPAR